MDEVVVPPSPYLEYWPSAVVYLLDGGALIWAVWRIWSAAAADNRVLAVLVTLDGLLFAVAGTVACRRQPRSLLGVLLVLAGLALYAEDLQAVLPMGVGDLFVVASTPVILHLTLAYPWGRLRSPGERALVAVAYGWAVVVPSLRVNCLWTTAPVSRCSPTLSALDIGNLLAGLIVVAVLIRRTFTSPVEERRLYLPILLAALVSAVPSLLLTVPFEVDSDREPIRLAYHLGLLLVPLAFLLGVVRVPGGIKMIALISDRLRAAQNPREVEAVLRRVLHDDSVRLGTWNTAAGGFVGCGEGGQHSERPAEVTELGGLRVGLFRSGTTWSDPHLMSAALRVATLALAHQTAADDERLRLRRDLHDGAQQTIVAAALKLRVAEDRARAGAEVPPELLATLRHDLEDSLTQLRRIGRGQPPTPVPDLNAALAAIAERTPAVRLVLDPPAVLDPIPVQTAYFIVAEAVTNALRHAGATDISVTATAWAGDSWRVVVADNGGGADAASLTKPGGGLEGLRQRAVRIGGSLQVRCGERGVVVDAVLPRRSVR